MKRIAEDVLALLHEHGEQLFALLVRLTLCADVAEDLLQELFCKLTESGGFRQADNPVAYAFRTATNLAFDWRRQRKRAPSNDYDCDKWVSPVESPQTDTMLRERLDQTLSALGQLPADSREIIVLRYLKDQSYEMIAEELGKTTHQVRALAFKAIVKLRQTLREKKHDPKSKSVTRPEPTVSD